MATKLKKHFPMIREREEVLAEIAGNPALRGKFEGWEPEQREEFLDLCTGVKGLKFLYDGFFREIMNPEYVPERFNDFLSEMLGQKVKVLKVLPNDSTRLADERSLLITDIVVELGDGSIANVEMQKLGYRFPGQRCACYSADLLLRQYKRVRGEKDKKFSYRDIKDVYTIILFERSPAEYKNYPEWYLHFFEQKSDSGLKLDFLQKYIFIPLDIFRENQHNKTRGIKGRREAWLTLFACDAPETVIQLIEQYPEFRGIYEEGYQICRNIERVMDMFSEELYELDRNTVQYMIDEMQETIDAQKAQLEEAEKAKKEHEKVLKKQEKALKEQKKEHDKALREQKKEHEQTLKEHDNALKEQKKERDNALKEQKKEHDNALREQKKEHEKALQEQKREREQTLRKTIEIFRSLNLPEEEIIQKICEAYGLTEAQAREYMGGGAPR